MVPKLKLVNIVLIACIFIAGLTAQAAAQKGRFKGIRQVVVLDPGHGGDDSGAAGLNGSAEKAISLNFAKILAAELGKSYEVVLTRNDDSTLGIEKRTALANYHRGDLFISIHCGGSFIKSTSGISIYLYQDFASDPPTRSEGLPEPDQQTDLPVLWTQAQSRFREKSQELADRIKGRLEELNSGSDIRVLGAPLLVLQGAGMPAFLIEIGHLSNPAEAKRLGDQRYLIDMARAIRRGIDDYLE